MKVSHLFEAVGNTMAADFVEELAAGVFYRGAYQLAADHVRQLGALVGKSEPGSPAILLGGMS